MPRYLNFPRTKLTDSHFNQCFHVAGMWRVYTGVELSIVQSVQKIQKIEFFISKMFARERFSFQIFSKRGITAA